MKSLRRIINELLKEEITVGQSGLDIPSKKFEIVKLASWGNAEDGYVVNDRYRTGDYVDIPDDLTDTKEMYLFLKAEGFFNQPYEYYDIDLSDEFVIFVSTREHGKPLFELVADQE